MSASPHICVVARDISGFMTGAFLSRRFPEFHISLADLRQNGKVLEESLYAVAHPELRRFNRTLGLKEGAFIQKTEAAIYLGDQYNNFGPENYVVPFGDWGASVDGVDFFDVQLAHDAFHSLSTQRPYSFPASMIAQNKFLPPDAKGRPVLSDFDYGYQFNPSAYADLLLSFSSDVHQLKFAEAIWENDTLILDGQKHEADLFIDASGDQQFDEDWTEFGFPSDFHTRTKPRQIEDGQPLSTTLSRASDIHVDITTQMDVHQITLAKSGQTPCGRRGLAWQGRVVRLGLSQARLAPLLGSPLRSISLDLNRLADLMPPSFPTDGTLAIEGHEYNRLTAEVYDRIRDIQCVVLQTAEWSKTRPKTLEDKTRLFSARGRLQVLDHDHLFQDQWPLVVLGQGIHPRRADILAALVSKSQVEATLGPIKNLIEKVLTTMPTHSDFIARTCAAPNYKHSPSGKAA